MSGQEPVTVPLLVAQLRQIAEQQARTNALLAALIEQQNPALAQRGRSAARFDVDHHRLCSTGGAFGPRELPVITGA